MWYQVFLGAGPLATPTTGPLNEMDLLSEIRALSKQGIAWTEMRVKVFRLTAREAYDLRDQYCA